VHWAHSVPYTYIGSSARAQIYSFASYKPSHYEIHIKDHYESVGALLELSLFPRSRVVLLLLAEKVGMGRRSMEGNTGISLAVGRGQRPNTSAEGPGQPATTDTGAIFLVTEEGGP